MPLQSGSSPSVISSNISELTHHGSRPRSHAQIVAIALSQADRSKRAEGGATGDDTRTTLDRMERDQDMGYFARQAVDHDKLKAAIVGKYGLGPTGYHDADNYANDLRIFEIPEAFEPLERASGGSASDAAWRIAHRDAGGYTPPAAPFFERQEARATTESPYGFTAGIGGGRTDKNNMSVAAGSYVIPADVVAGLGDGNSLSGAHVWNQILNSMPWAVTPPRSTGHRGPPPPPHDAYLAQGITGTQKEPTLAAGGEVPEVPIASADGEIIASPEHVLRVGQHYASKRDIENYPASHDRIMRRGHRVLDEWIKHERGKNIAKLRSLKGPVGSANPHIGHTKTKAA